MVRMPSGALGVDVASLERALNCHEFESGVGEKVARAVRVLVLHPQVIQLYDELRTMVESPRLWQEVEMKFFNELIEVSHQDVILNNIPRKQSFWLTTWWRWES